MRFNRTTSPDQEASQLTLRLWDFTGTALLNLFVILFLVAYLSPLPFMIISSLTPHDQFLDSNAPILPSKRIKFHYEGKDLIVYQVPTEEGIKHWALYKPSRRSSQFIDPENPEAGPILWEGAWRTLKADYTFAPTLDNFKDFFAVADIPLYLKNTIVVAIISEIGVLASSIAVAYGLSRFRIPGLKYIFFLLIATIMIPSNITLVPTYYLYSGHMLNWIGTWLPLIVPHFFGSAILIFLLRQNFKSIPRDLDEAAMLDGAGPLRILISVILPQSIPVVVTVALLHFFYIWNETRLSSLYLGIAPHRQMISFAVQRNQTYFFTPEVLMVGALVVMIVPVIVLFLSQRFFMQDMIVTQIEK
ncbi:MAG TPA: carbohydrate ABC transporter permease [Anaerolineales bacterium]|jgi:multiple sugar transport system permease protein|nr:carbohydrate ABC transporter permease [Anaerolineales bacterium]